MDSQNEKAVLPEFIFFDEVGVRPEHTQEFVPMPNAVLSVEAEPSEDLRAAAEAEDAAEARAAAIAMPELGSADTGDHTDVPKTGEQTDTPETDDAPGMYATEVVFGPYHEGDSYQYATEISDADEGVKINLNNFSNTKELLIVTNSGEHKPRVFLLQFGEKPEDPKDMIELTESIASEELLGWRFNEPGALPELEFGKPLDVPAVDLGDGTVLEAPQGNLINLIALHGDIPATSKNAAMLKELVEKGELEVEGKLIRYEACNPLTMYKAHLEMAVQRGLANHARSIADSKDNAAWFTDGEGDRDTDSEPAKVVTAVPAPDYVPTPEPAKEPDAADAEPLDPSDEESAPIMMDVAYLRNLVSNSRLARRVKNLYRRAMGKEKVRAAVVMPELGTDPEEEATTRRLSITALKDRVKARRERRTAEAVVVADGEEPAAPNASRFAIFALGERIRRRRNTEVAGVVAGDVDPADLATREAEERRERRIRNAKRLGFVALVGAVATVGALTGGGHEHVTHNAPHAAAAVPPKFNFYPPFHNIQNEITTALNSLSKVTVHAAHKAAHHATHAKAAVHSAAHGAAHAAKHVFPRVAAIGNYGGTVWGVAKAELGKHATDHQIWVKTAHLLKENHITWPGAHFLSAAKEIITR